VKDLYSDVFPSPVLGFIRSETQLMLAELTSGGKVAIAGFNSEIDSLMEIFTARQARGVTFFRGKDNIWPHMRSWLFDRISFNEMQFQLTQLQASGIYQFWKYWLRGRQFELPKLKHSDDPVPLTLDANIFFVFVAFMLGLGLGVVLALIEIVVYYFKNCVISRGSKVIVLEPKILQHSNSWRKQKYKHDKSRPRIWKRIQKPRIPKAVSTLDNATDYSYNFNL